MQRAWSSLLLASTCASVAQAIYSIQTDYTGANFFDGFDFFTDADPTNGNVKFLDETTANTTGLAGFLDLGNGTSAIYMAADSTAIVPESSGRASIRVSSQKAFQHGLFIIDIHHMPAGCGTWPSFWMVGQDWPNDGEIDIVEGVNLNTNNSMTLHTSPVFGINSTAGSTADVLGTDCSANNAQLGCSMMANSNVSFGSGFNDNLGGVYATEWTSDSIKIWFWPRNLVPGNMSTDSPVPTDWGTPTASFVSNGNSTIDDHFKNMQLIFDTTFCGDWAGQPAVWNASECGTLAPTCAEYVLNTPSAFTEAYWAVNSLRVYQDD